MEIDGIPQIPSEEWEAWLDEEGGIAIDVREPVEWTGGTLPGARLVSLRDLPGTAEDLDRSTPLLLVCRSGRRSQAAAVFLTRTGLGRVAKPPAAWWPAARRPERSPPDDAVPQTGSKRAWKKRSCGGS